MTCVTSHKDLEGRWFVVRRTSNWPVREVNCPRFPLFYNSPPPCKVAHFKMSPNRTDGLIVMKMTSCYRYSTTIECPTENLKLYRYTQPQIIAGGRYPHRRAEKHLERKYRRAGFESKSFPGTFMQVLDFYWDGCTGLRSLFCQLYANSLNKTSSQEETSDPPNFVILYMDESMALVHTCTVCRNSISDVKYQFAYILSRNMKYSRSKAKILETKLINIPGIKPVLIDVLSSDSCKYVKVKNSSSDLELYI
ncbi:uncharacterized protein LOC142354335 isoform X2 [Convolutriloba macropyga]|uniref:uncharacterized protein LOC142354335 isoform X2 n=1 Tax=Convolutriloba macropyga TaxID=536237 RepID=UPI003F5204B4